MSVPAIKKIMNYLWGENEESEAQYYSEEEAQVDYGYDEEEETTGEELKQKNAVVINLEYVSKDVARRIVDVVSGATKAIDGHMEKVSNSIFVVAPFNYDIVNEITKEKIENKFSPSWIK